MGTGSVSLFVSFGKGARSRAIKPATLLTLPKFISANQGRESWRRRRKPRRKPSPPEVTGAHLVLGPRRYDLQISRGPRSRQAAERCSAAFVLDSRDLAQSGIARHLAVRKNINDSLFDPRMGSFILRLDVELRHERPHAAAVRRHNNIGRE